jgi:hypothetical protein
MRPLFAEARVSLAIVRYLVKQQSMQCLIDAMDKARHISRRKAGSITFGGATIACTICSISSAGAAIEITSPFDIQDQFILEVAIENMQVGAPWSGARKRVSASRPILIIES